MEWGAQSLRTTLGTKTFLELVFYSPILKSMAGFFPQTFPDLRRKNPGMQKLIFRTS